MPISNIPVTNETTAEQFLFTNGELKALQDVVKTWKFKDSVSALRFAIAVLVKASENKSLYIESNGRKIEIVPNPDSLLTEVEDSDVSEVS